MSQKMSENVNFAAHALTMLDRLENRQNERHRAAFQLDTSSDSDDEFDDK